MQKLKIFVVVFTNVFITKAFVSAEITSKHTKWTLDTGHKYQFISEKKNFKKQK